MCRYRFARDQGEPGSSSTASSTAPASRLRTRIGPSSASRCRIGLLWASISAVKRLMPSAWGGTVGEPAHQGLADSAALPGFEDREGDLGAVAALGVPNVAGDADASSALGIDRQERLVIVMIDLGQVAQLGGAQRPVRTQEAAVDRLAAALRER